MPAILNVNGHGPGGKAVEHKQKRCINQARRGIIALNMEWFEFGELSAEGDQHEPICTCSTWPVSMDWVCFTSRCVGASTIFMNDANVDRARIGMTGLSGGGWQTIMLSSLDPRVGPAVPVAGFSSLTTGIEHPGYSGGDPEQNSPDMRQGVDYAQLAAMRAPRPTLLIYNDMDDCCFRAGVVKQGSTTTSNPSMPYMASRKSPVVRQPGSREHTTTSSIAGSRSYEFFDSVFHLRCFPKRRCRHRCGSANFL